MSIYHLYIKTHNKTGLKYLGQTKQNPFTYIGSGKYWLNHLKVHGQDISTEILGTYETKEQLKEAGLHYSKIYDIVESKEWANLKEEAGDGGDPGPYANKNISNTVKKLWKMGIYLPKTTEQKENYRQSKLGSKNPNFGNTYASSHLNIINFTCSKCGIITTKGNWSRWHETKCKNIGE